MRPLRRRTVIGLVTLTLAALIGLGLYQWMSLRIREDIAAEPLARPEMPADLARVRDRFSASLAAIQRGDGAEAAMQLRSFSFGSRAVEEYRLYYLATALQMTGAISDTRATLARLLARNPRFAYRQDAAFTLASLYSSVGDWRPASDVYAVLAGQADQQEVGGMVRGEYIKTKFYSGDVGAILFAAHRVMTDNPAASFAEPSAGLLRDLLQIDPANPLPLSLEERVDRVGKLVADYPDVALTEIEGIDRSRLSPLRRDEITFDHGMALQRLRRFEESNKDLESLASGQYRSAIPALFQAAQNYRLLAASINPIRYKTVMQKIQIGKRRVKGKVRPVYRNVKRSVKVTDLNLLARKTELERLGTERLKDVLQLPAEQSMRLATLTQLLQTAAAKNQDSYMRELTAEIVKIEPYNDQTLQWFWDRAWAAWQRGDLTSARDLFTFISTTYRNPAVQRQSTYWLARTMERSGEKAKAAAIYQQLASVPFEDLYAKFAVMRGANAPERPARPLAGTTDDWQAVADRQIPKELKLAYELTALGAPREARAEVQANSAPANHMYADAILGELFYTEGSTVVALRLLKRAFPQLATVEQDQVPVHFVKMYYPLRYEESIRRYARQRSVDPYLIMALIHQESGFDAVARSGPGARGLMQIMPATGREIGRKLHGMFSDRQLDDPDTNIELGAYYVNQLLVMFGGSQELAVAAYNAGLGNVHNWKTHSRAPLDELLEGMPFAETRNYVKRVTILRSSYHQYDPR
jgi:soluble lytic murein transglycosylase-like protein